MNVLQQKSPLLFFNHFMESIFFFNDCTTHTVYNQYQQSEKEKTMFSLAGPANESYVPAQTVGRGGRENVASAMRFDCCLFGMVGSAW